MCIADVWQHIQAAGYSGRRRRRDRALLSAESPLPSQWLRTCTAAAACSCTFCEPTSSGYAPGGRPGQRCAWQCRQRNEGRPHSLSSHALRPGQARQLAANSERFPTLLRLARGALYTVNVLTTSPTLRTAGCTADLHSPAKCCRECTRSQASCRSCSEE